MGAMGVQVRAVHPLQSGKTMEFLGPRLRPRRHRQLGARATSEADGSAGQNARGQMRGIAAVALSSTSLFALTAAAAAAAATTTAAYPPGEDMAVPALLSVMLGGAVYGALSDPRLRQGMAEAVAASGTQSSAPAKEPLASAVSESTPSGALEGRSIAPIMAAMEERAVSTSKAQPTADVAAPAAAAPDALAADAVAFAAPRQVEALAATPAPLMSPANTPAGVSRDTEAVKPAVAQPSPEPVRPPTSFTPVMAAQSGPAAPLAAASPPRPGSFFAQAAQGARALQTEYEQRITAIRVEMERRQQEDAQRRQLRMAKINSLQATAAAEAAADATPQPARHLSQGPLARMLGLLTSMWYWIKHHVQSLIGQSTSTSSSAPSSV